MNIDEINKKLKPLRDEVTRTLFVTGGLMLGVTIFMLLASNTRSKDPFSPSSSSFAMFAFIIWMLILLAITNFLVQPKIRVYKEKAKILVNKTLFETAFTNVDYVPTQGFDQDAMQQLGIMETGNRYSTNDFVRGEYNGITFERADVLSENVTKNGKTSTTETYFHGQVIMFDFHKDTTGYIRIRDAGWFNKFTDGPRTDDSRKIKFEDDRFNKQWATFTNNEQEAYRVFTPHFMEKINEFRARLGYELSMVVKDGVVYLGIYSSHDVMEPSVYTDVDEGYVKEIAQEIATIQYIIDTLTENKEYFRG